MFVRSSLRVPCCVVLCGTFLVGTPAWAGTCRVTTAGSQFNDGSSWAAPTTLRQALTFPEICNELWVAKGIYKPGSAAAVTSYFPISNGVQVYGGFATGETAREQRDPELNLTVLSGDIDGNDPNVDGVVLSAFDIVGTNSENVLIMAGTGPTTVLDGFTITAGFGSLGAGLLVAGPAPSSPCSPVLSHLVFSGNAALKPGGNQRGGALYVDAASGSTCAPTLTDVYFRGNQAGAGGAIYNAGFTGTASPSLTRVVFEDNRARGGGGGAIINAGASGTSNTAMSQVVFTGNGATTIGGAIVNIASGASGKASGTVDRALFVGNNANQSGGAIANVTEAAGAATVSPSITNATFSGNTAQSKGGAVYNIATPSTSVVAPTLANVTMAGNQVALGGSGGAMLSERFAGTAAPVLRNAILWGNTAPAGQEIVISGGATTAVDHSIVKGSGGSAAWNATFGTDGGGNLDADPLLEALSDDIGDTKTMRPAAGGPAVDAGLNCVAADQRGIVRPQGPQCDMGAVEVFTTKLIFRNSFDEGICWTGALSKSVFLTRVRTALDGATICIPPFLGNVLGVDITACTDNDCAGGTPGCPVTITAGPFDDGGDFPTGHFTSTGTASDVTFPVSSPLQDCEYTASNITTSYAVDYVFTDDGYGGAYTSLLNQFVPSATSLTLSSGNANCQNVAESVKNAFVNEARKAVAAARRPALEAATLDETVCPLQ